jgi:hypothetical protein
MRSRTFLRAASCDALEPRRLLSVPAGPEFRVNTNTPYDQENPAIAMDAAGNFVIVWTSLLEEGLTNGNFYDVFAQRYNAAGEPQGGEFRVNSYTQGVQRFWGVAMNAAGEFIVTYKSDTDNRGGGGFAQRFTAAGVPQGPELRLSTYGTAVVALDNAGNFVAVGGSEPDFSVPGLYARRYDADGEPLGAAFLVNTYTTGTTGNPDVAMSDAGDFTIVWDGSTPGGYGRSVFARQYAVDGTPLGADFRVNHFTALRDHVRASVAMRSGGDFIVAWEGQLGSHFPDIFARRYNGNGTPLGDQFRVNSYTTASQSAPAIAMDEQSNFIVVWSGPDDGGESEVSAQGFNSAGLPDGSQLRVNTYTTSGQGLARIAIDNDGDFVVVWNSLGQDASNAGVYAQRFITPPQLVATSFNYQTAPMSLTFLFSEDVSASLSSSDIVLQNLTTGTAVPTASVALSYDSVTNLATFTFPGYAGGILPDGDYLATIRAADVVDRSGHSLQSDATFSFFHLGGDANHDRRVNVTDLGILATNWQQSPRMFVQGDFNLDRLVDNADLGILASNWQATLDSRGSSAVTSIRAPAPQPRVASIRLHRPTSGSAATSTLWDETLTGAAGGYATTRLS